MPLPQKTSKSSKQSVKNQAKKKGIADGKKKSDDRKALAGRNRQGNHDSRTKQTKRHDDRHDHGIKVAGRAG
jgi:hypothetical protein